MSPVKSPVRKLALELLGLAETSNHPLPDLLERKGLELEGAGHERDVGLLRYLVLGTLRQRGTLDWLLGQVSTRPPEKLQPAVLNLLRLGAFQLQDGSRIPAHAAVNESVALARKLFHQGIAGFVNAVLRALTRRQAELLALLEDPGSMPDALERLALRSSHPLWLVKRWGAELGENATQARCTWDNREPPVDLRVNLARLGRDEALADLTGQGIEATPLDTRGGLRLTHSADLPRVLAGAGQERYYVQSRLSQVAAEQACALARQVLADRAADAPQPVVLDACAAPGGKSLVLAQGLPDSVRIVAYDASEKRRHRLHRNLQRLGALQRVELVQDESALEPLAGRCALVLVDAPCTALGVLRRHPEMRWRRTEGDPARLHQLQLQVLRRFRQYLQPGGALLYCVCSFEPEETRDVIQALLAEGGLRLASLEATAPPDLKPEGGGLISRGLEGGEDGYFRAGALAQTRGP